MSLAPDSATPGGGSVDPVEYQAARWFVERDRGLTAKQAAEFSEWLKADACHAQVFGEFEDTWSLLLKAESAVSAPVAARQIRPAAWLAVAAAAAAALAAVCLPNRMETGEKGNFATSALTVTGELRPLHLPDGSVVQLSADSGIDVHFTDGRREVELRHGEANFQVAKNPRRPFIVRAEGVEVQAVGTAFDVDLRPNSLELVVTEGRVQVRDARTGGSLLILGGSGVAVPLVLEGQRVRIPLSPDGSPAAARPAAIPVRELDRLRAWEKRQLYFEADRLTDIAAEFNRFNRHKLAVGSPELAERKFGGTFSAGDYESFVNSLEAYYGVAAQRLPHQTILGLRPAPPAAVAPPPPEAGRPAAESERLVFSSERLDNIAAAFNRHNGNHLMIDDPALAGRRFGGTFPAGDYEAFVKVLEDDFHIQVVRSPHQIVLRAAPATGSDSERNP